MVLLSKRDLTPDQTRAYGIIASHLGETLAGEHPSQLRMLIIGEGGVGRSKVVEMVTSAFTHKAARCALVKAAFTGITASLIDGKTTLDLGHTPIRRDGTVSDEAEAKLQELWRTTDYLIIENFSMMTKTSLARLSRIVSIGKHGGDGQGNGPFGAMNVILCGSRDQFAHPPVGTADHELLYKPVDHLRDSEECRQGREIYETFTTVVIVRPPRPEGMPELI